MDKSEAIIQFKNAETFRNIKNGRIYLSFNQHIINTTNNSPEEDKEMVLYMELGGITHFVRERREFLTKFVKVKNCELKQTGCPYINVADQDCDECSFYK